MRDMRRIAVVTDSAACIPVHLVQKYSIHVVPFETGDAGAPAARWAHRRGGVAVGEPPAPAPHPVPGRRAGEGGRGGPQPAPGRGTTAATFHADARPEAERLAAEVCTRFDCRECWVTEFTPVMGVHSGPGTLGVAFCAEEQEEGNL